jgi:hypothetical protein
MGSPQAAQEAGNKEPLVALYDHAVRTYEAMLQHSERQTLDEGEVPEIVLVYEGFLTKLLKEELQLAVPYYTSVTRALIAMGCVRQLRRGGGNSPSSWQLITAPTRERFETMKSRKRVKTDTERNIDNLVQRTRDLTKRVSTLEGQVGALLQEVLNK